MEILMEFARKVGEIFCCINRTIRQFLLPLRQQAVESLPTPPPPPPPSPPPSLPYPEEVAQPVTHQVVEAHSHGEQNVQHWPMLVINSCCNWATQIASQTAFQPRLQPSLACHWLSVATVFAFSSAFISRFVISKSLRAARVLEHLAILFAVTAFFLAITMSFPICLKCLSWPLYALCLLACFFHWHV
ncbi:hypothetical protein PVL29_022269 [Vitis rotundifolia]|uniref:Uncharacterized protein n=1 Tax=Vitis rotundifolia TaxID=103349 RepID=A0AA38YUY8_VITRO|nr:hypothetical protein PVL29_022269 [Vitis rotundifolia]